MDSHVRGLVGVKSLAHENILVTCLLWDSNARTSNVKSNVNSIFLVHSDLLISALPAVRVLLSSLHSFSFEWGPKPIPADSIWLVSFCLLHSRQRSVLDTLRWCCGERSSSFCQSSRGKMSWNQFLMLLLASTASFSTLPGTRALVSHPADSAPCYETAAHLNFKESGEKMWWIFVCLCLLTCWVAQCSEHFLHFVRHICCTCENCAPAKRKKRKTVVTSALRGN